MKFQWLLAKYMQDLRRREPRNVGVLLFADERPLTLFLGQSSDGSIERRKIATVIGETKNYVAWCKYWEYAATSLPRDKLVERLGDSNYYLEWGGELLTSREETSPEAFLDELFRTLVSRPGADQDDKPDRAEVLLRRLNILDSVEHGCSFEVPFGDDALFDEIVFDYRYQNGRSTLMKKLSVGRQRNRDKVRSAAWGFDRVKQLDQSQRIVALVDVSRSGLEAKRQQAALAHTSTQIVRLDDEDRAAEQLGEYLKL